MYNWFKCNFENSIIGSNVVIQDNSKIGQKGFIFIPKKKHKYSSYWKGNNRR